MGLSLPGGHGLNDSAVFWTLKDSSISSVFLPTFDIWSIYHRVQTWPAYWGIGFQEWRLVQLDPCFAWPQTRLPSLRQCELIDCFKPSPKKGRLRVNEGCRPLQEETYSCVSCQLSPVRSRQPSCWPAAFNWTNLAKGLRGLLWLACWLASLEAVLAGDLTCCFTGDSLSGAFLTSDLTGCLMRCLNWDVSDGYVGLWP